MGDTLTYSLVGDTYGAAIDPTTGQFSWTPTAAGTYAFTVQVADSFGLTANNVTYALLGDGMNYWKFFPGPEGWGRMPVWGFSVVADANGTDLEDGARIYGYMPPSSHMLVTPDRVDERGFVDAAPHRAELPSAYQGYRLTSGDEAYVEGKEAEQMLFWPLLSALLVRIRGGAKSATA